MLPGVTAVALDRPDVVAAVLRAPGGAIAAYGSREARPTPDFWPLLFANTIIRRL